MAATQTKIRRGTASQIDAMTPVEGEVIADLTNDRLRLGDGTTAGAIHQASAKDIQQQAFTFGVAGGSANALTVTLAPVPASYGQPMTFKFKAIATNTGATTINVNSLGVKNIYKVDGGSIAALVAGDIVNGAIYEVTYDGTQFQLQNISSASQSSGMVLLEEKDATGLTNVDFTTGIGSDYRHYVVKFGNMRLSTSFVSLRWNARQSGTWITSAALYFWDVDDGGITSSSSYGNLVSVDGSPISWMIDASGTINFYNLGSTAGSASFDLYGLSADSSTYFRKIEQVGFLNLAGPFDGLRFSTSSGAFTSGKIQLYGLA